MLINFILVLCFSFHPLNQISLVIVRIKFLILKQMLIYKPLLFLLLQNIIIAILIQGFFKLKVKFFKLKIKQQG